MAYPKVETWGKDERGRPFYKIWYTLLNRRILDEDELRQLYEQIRANLPPDEADKRTVIDRVEALERTIGECPCHNHSPKQSGVPNVVHTRKRP